MSVPEADFVGEATCSWGRVRVSVWTVRPLARSERERLRLRLGAVHTELERRGEQSSVGLQVLEAAIKGPGIVSARAEVLPSPRGVRSGEPPPPRPGG